MIWIKELLEVDFVIIIFNMVKEIKNLRILVINQKYLKQKIWNWKI